MSRQETPPFALSLDRVHLATSMLVAPMRKGPEAPLQLALLFKFGLDGERPIAVCLQSAGDVFALVHDLIEMAKRVWPDEVEAVIAQSLESEASPPPKKEPLQ